MKMLKRVRWLMIFLSAAVSAQVQFDKTDADLGTLSETSARFADFSFTNQSSETVFILRTEVPDDCSIRLFSKEVQQGGKGIIRVQYNPLRKGPFERKVAVYLSSQPKPVYLSVHGNSGIIVESDDIACPNFNTPADQKTVKQVFSVQVVDSMTMRPISLATVRYEPNPFAWPANYTDREGMVKPRLPIGIYSISANAKGYAPGSVRLYVGKNTAGTVILLAPLAGPLVTIENKIDTAETEIPDVPEEVPIINPGELSSDFVPNNIVFLIDVSSSMGTPDKLPLLKTSMNNLLSSLRGIDRVSIVTYASGTDVVLNSTPANRKERIANRIEKLSANGTTQGGKGIREAYKVAEENYIRGGNNIVIIATDGDFNLDKSDDELFKLIHAEADKGITMSVVGFGNKERAIDKMRKIAAKGNGSYIHIANEDEADVVLLDEVKLRSKKAR